MELSSTARTTYSKLSIVGKKCLRAAMQARILRQSIWKCQNSGLPIHTQQRPCTVLHAATIYTKLLKRHSTMSMRDRQRSGQATSNHFHYYCKSLRDFRTSTKISGSVQSATLSVAPSLKARY